MRLLLAEDERDLNRIITKKLTSSGYSVDSFFDGQEAIDVLAYTDYDAVILDIMMPKADGFAVLRAIRDAGKTTPVLFLTARDAVSDRVKGLDSGANDYLIKPFSFDELLARIRAMTRTSFGAADNLLTVADITLDTKTQVVRRAGREVTLSAKEYALLEYLLRHQGQTLTRSQISDHVWNFDFDYDSNIVDVYIRYLRNKVDKPFPNKLIHTVRGFGYVMRCGDA